MNIVIYSILSIIFITCIISFVKTIRDIAALNAYERMYNQLAKENRLQEWNMEIIQERFASYLK